MPPSADPLVAGTLHGDATFAEVTLAVQPPLSFDTGRQTEGATVCQVS